MRDLKQRTYELTIKETRTYTVLATANSKFEAEQEGVERFHRLRKSNELPASDVSKPRVVGIELRK